MSPFTIAPRGSLFAMPLAVLAFAAQLTACGSDGGVATFLPPGPPTSAGPGNLVLYAAMAAGNRIDAFRLGTDGLLPSEPFDSIFVAEPRRIAVANGVLYATLIDRIIAVKLGADGSMPSIPSSHSLTREDYEPVDLEVRDNILYVAASGIGLVQSFELDQDGNIPVEPSASGQGEFPSDYASLALDSDFLYSGSRDTDFIDAFLLREDGNVPALAEPQDPQDNIALPDDIIVHEGTLYVTSASDRSVRAYKLLPNGFLPGDETSRTRSEEYYEDILIENDILYAAAYNAGRVDLYAINPGGSLPEDPPFYSTFADTAAFPISMVIKGGILYVAQGGLNRIDAYVLDGAGRPSQFPSSSTSPPPGAQQSFPVSIALAELD
jgi:hypothetical protein